MRNSALHPITVKTCKATNLVTGGKRNNLLYLQYTAAAQGTEIVILILFEIRAGINRQPARQKDDYN